MVWCDPLQAYTDKRLHDNILYSGLPNLYDTFTLVASALQGEKIDTSKASGGRPWAMSLVV